MGMLMGFYPCETLFSDVTLKNDSDIFVVVTVVASVDATGPFSGSSHAIYLRVTWEGRGEEGFKQVNHRVRNIPSLGGGGTTQTHLQVKELAVASEDDLCAAIAPGHFDDVDLVKTGDWMRQVKPYRS